MTLGARNSVRMADVSQLLGGGAFIGANALLLGPIVVGEGAKVGAGAVVLERCSRSLDCSGKSS